MEAMKLRTSYLPVWWWVKSFSDPSGEKMSLGSRRAADSWILSNLECDLTQNSLLLFIDRTEYAIRWELITKCNRIIGPLALYCNYRLNNFGLFTTKIVIIREINIFNPYCVLLFFILLVKPWFYCF